MWPPAKRSRHDSWGARPDQFLLRYRWLAVAVRDGDDVEAFEPVAGQIACRDRPAVESQATPG